MLNQTDPSLLVVNKFLLKLFGHVVSEDGSPFATPSMPEMEALEQYKLSNLLRTDIFNVNVCGLDTLATYLSQMSNIFMQIEG